MISKKIRSKSGTQSTEAARSKGGSQDAKSDLLSTKKKMETGSTKLVPFIDGNLMRFICGPFKWRSILGNG
ncbi:hypothetical protein MTR_5g087400 [Medicago truncatula]|uniref:Uncharacterized protein n=1 Tax=Medicago truncatula TaxID=3880 RepID=G7KHF9_MEDTR|nr:hypothetical protein MTR_5g087400 [Medicago truncatula]